ncbi:S9 family peptidase [Viridibacillus sp. YIM B01967]|uniref:S9 family peptidase n=1 Tax=Viridibacillus soli TaxID=2798301 RepID=A0ABS1H986_9BACL|nr:S9 family peptidase [Viridibacillus soli]MBK3495983.1 S9 family peptidase [Viridibacillus soli]
MTKRLLKAEDLYALHSITNPQLSPNGEEAVFTRTYIDEEKNKYVAHLFHLDVESGAVTQWTYGENRVSSPSWSADGKSVAFLSNRNEQNQIYIIATNGGEARQLTTLANGVSQFRWSPCGKNIWFSGRLKEGKKFTDLVEKEEKKKPTAYIVDGMKYKADGKGLLPQGIYNQIGKIDVATGDVQLFSEGNHHYSLEAVSHDGGKLVMSVNRAENKDFDFSQQIILVDIETKEETTIFHEEGHYGDAYFSYDDRYIAFYGSDRKYKNASHGAVYIYDTEEQRYWNLTQDFDAPVGDAAVADHQQGATAPTVVWTEANDLYFQVSTMGDIRLYYATLDGAIYPASPEGEHVYGYDVERNGAFALLAISNPVLPGEIFKYDVTTGASEQVTHFNDDFVEEVELVQPEAISYKSSDSLDVYGWLMKPAQYEEGKKYPLIVEIHGGPHTMYANSFFHELQLLAAQGYGVLYVNPRGSHGYSQEFVDAVRSDYGGGDYEDVMAGIDAVLAEHSWIDKERLGVTGGSYGGFMTNWIVGHTNRFKAAVTQRSISNWISFFGVSDIGYYFTDWQMGTDMKDVEKLWQHSPLKYAENVETPLLILHSEKDFRCPIEQAEQLYITLKSMGKETQFVRFPDADHNLSRTGLPSLRIERLAQITGWFEKYL